VIGYVERRATEGNEWNIGGKLVKSKKSSHKQSSLWYVSKFSYELLTRTEKRKYLFLSLFQVILNLLELFALLLVIVLISLSSEKITTVRANETWESYLRWIGFGEKSNNQTLFWVALATASIFLVKTVSSIFINRKTLHFLSTVSTRLSTQALEQHVTRYDSRNNIVNSSEVIFSLSSIIRKLIFLILGSIPILIADLTLLSLLLTILFIYNPLMTAIVVLLFGSAFGASHLIVSRKTHFLGNQVTKNDVEANSLILNLIRNRKEIWVKGSTLHLLKMYNLVRSQHFLADSHLIFLQNSSRYILDIVVPLGAFVLISLQVFVFSSLQGTLSLSVFLVAGIRLAPAIVKIQSNLLGMKTVNGEVLNTLEFFQNLNKEPLYSKYSKSKISDNLRIGSITFEDVSYRYSDKDNFELKNVNWEIKFGEIVAIVGPSGSGKSTLVDLGLGLLEPLKGKILFGKQPPLEVILNNPGKIAYLPQDTRIIGGSVRDNIVFGSGQLALPDSLVWQVLEKTNLKNFIQSLENGLDTQIGEFGVALSGGQKQRLGLARALISDPVLIILDEITSALDIDSENAVKKMLLDCKREKTIVIVSHSANLIEIADQVVTIENGELVKVKSIS